MAIKLGNNSVSLHLGSDEVKEIYLGNVKIYEKASSEFATIHICGQASYYGFYKVNDGIETAIPNANYIGKYETISLSLLQQKSITLNNVSKLEASSQSGDISYIRIYDNTGQNIYYEDLDYETSNYLDITSHLIEGCYVVVYTAY